MTPIRWALHIADRGRVGWSIRWIAGLWLMLAGRRPQSPLVWAPLRGLQEPLQRSDHWVAIDGDPAFEAATPWWGLPRGWCRVRLELQAAVGSGCAKLYFDSVGGYSERRCALLGSPTPHGALEAEIYLPLAVRRLRLDPAEAPGHFRIGALQIAPLSMYDNVLRAGRGLLQRPRRAAGVLLRRAYRALGREPLAGSAQALDYASWLKAVEPSAEQMRLALERLTTEHAPIALSIIMPVYNPEPAHLAAAIESVRGQVYPHWELCICDDASTDRRTAEALEAFAASEPRIRLRRRAGNGGIAAATADALALARGDFVAFLDQDDVLPAWSLLRVAQTLALHPDTDLLYSDEDKLDEHGRRCEPHFKPAWNEELLHAVNYFGHLLVIRRSLVAAAGGPHPGFDGSQDYDLVLRCTAKTAPDRIRHLPGILYHWRKSRGSTAQRLGAKGGAHAAGLAALRSHFAGGSVQVEDGPFPTSYRLRHTLPVAPRVSIIIPTRDGGDALERCIDSIRRHSTYAGYELVVVDNQSRDPRTLAYLASLQQRPDTRVISYDRPFNFSAINNHAVQQVDGEVVVLLNDDVEVLTPDWLEEMLSWLYRPGVGAVGGKLLYPDGRVQHAGVMLGIGGVAGHSHKYHPGRHMGYFGRLVLPQSVSALTGACLMVRREVYLNAGGLDGVNLQVAFNDVDFCLRLRERGLRSVWTPYAQLVHFESLSRGAEDTPAKRERFAREVRYMQSRWGTALRNDPYYSPYLTLEHEDFSLSPAAPSYLDVDARQAARTERDDRRGPTHS